jgi:hypothetical protein
VDFWAPGLNLPEGVRFPRSINTGVDGRFEILLPPASWHLLVNTASDYVHQKILASKLTGKQPTPIGTGTGPVITVKPNDKKHFFYPDGRAALDLKARADTQRAVVQLRRVTLRGKVVGPDGKPVKQAVLYYRHPVPAAREVPVRPDMVQNLTDTLALNGMDSFSTVLREPMTTPVEVRGGKFELPLRDLEAGYQLHFLDAKNQLGRVVELTGKLAVDGPATVKLWSCVSAKARLVDAKGKPRAKYQPLVWMLVPPGPHPVRHDLAVWSYSPAGKVLAGVKEVARKKGWAQAGLWSTPDQIWLGQADPLHYGKGFVTDAKGNLTLPTLIPGATYRILNVDGKAKDFKVEPNRALDLGKLVIKEPVRKARVATPGRLINVDPK